MTLFTLLYRLTSNQSTSLFSKNFNYDGSYYNSVGNNVCRYKVDPNEIPVEQQAGSTLPLMEIPGRDVEADEDYNPFEHRKLAHPTS